METEPLLQDDHFAENHYSWVNMRNLMAMISVISIMLVSFGMRVQVTEENEELKAFTKRLWIFISTHNRVCLLNIAAKSLSDSTNVNFANLVVMDMHSETYGEHDLMRFYPGGKVFRFAKNKGADVLDHLKHRKFLNVTKKIPDAIYVDLPMDVVVEKDWIRKLWEYYRAIPNDIRQTATYTLYNSPILKNVPSPVKGLITKKVTPFMNTVWPRNTVKMWIDHYGEREEVKSYDWKMAEFHNTGKLNAKFILKHCKE